MDFETFTENINTFILYGDKDEFSTNDHIKKQENLLKKSKLNYKLIEFDGTHDVPKNILIELTNTNNW